LLLERTEGVCGAHGKPQIVPKPRSTTRKCLFSLRMHFASRNLQQVNLQPKITEKLVRELLFADYLALVAHTESAMQ